MINCNNDDLMSDEKIIEKLKSMGVKIVYKPMAIVPDYLDSDITFGNENNFHSTIEMDIHKAYQKIKRIQNIIGDPFA